MMTQHLLKSLDIQNFRSIRGNIHVPLDANVVLVHGENGAGKTSLLSAIELALTGKVQSLEHADPRYEQQLLHRTAASGGVSLQTVFENAEYSFNAALLPSGAKSLSALDINQATFFRERAFLPQSLLGQLLQIYQNAGSNASSPLAKFVAKLLGLDRLDALESGLKVLNELRNTRKVVDGWGPTENEKARVERLIIDQKEYQAEIKDKCKAALDVIQSCCIALQIDVQVSEISLFEIESILSEKDDVVAFAVLSDQQRKLASIRREIEGAQKTAPPAIPIAADANLTKEALDRWDERFGGRVKALRQNAEELLPNTSLPSSPDHFSEAVLPGLVTARDQLVKRTEQARADIVRYAAAKEELSVHTKQCLIIDEELSRLSNNAGSLAVALAELTSFISDEICPVCDRDFSELGKEPLGDHVHSKVKILSASAERLLVLGRARSEAQVSIERLEREIEAVEARKLDDKRLAELDRRLASFENAIKEVEALVEILREGGRLRAADVAARRAATAAEARNMSLAAANDTLTDFIFSIDLNSLEDDEPFNIAAPRVEATLAQRAIDLEQRLALRRQGIEQITIIRSLLIRISEGEARLNSDVDLLKRIDAALARGQRLRVQGNAIRTAVDHVRSSIIRREFNDRLNRLWRDLFVRLAPGEPFVPAFRIPEASTQKLEPKLITTHRDGGLLGGAPGAMLSAGNLNTAALTLFIALHLSVPRELPWLILDDPVQSMDEVHVAQFAALLRTLSKEHGRQIVIAVHDRQLFEYLKLELSPAFPEDSLLTLELSRGQYADSLCVHQRYSYKQERALLVAA